MDKHPPSVPLSHHGQWVHVVSLTKLVLLHSSTSILHIYNKPGNNKLTTTDEQKGFISSLLRELTFILYIGLEVVNKSMWEGVTRRRRLGNQRHEIIDNRNTRMGCFTSTWFFIVLKKCHHSEVDPRASEKNNLYL